MITIPQLIKLVDKAEEKCEEYVFLKLYGDGSGGLYTEDKQDPELCSWDSDSEIEKTIKEWMKE